MRQYLGPVSGQSGHYFAGVIIKSSVESEEVSYLLGTVYCIFLLPTALCVAESFPLHKEQPVGFLLDIDFLQFLFT